jgi:hypothetical protein
MKSNAPFWYNGIYYWCRIEPRIGLTIPFIVGKSRTLTNSSMKKLAIE